MIIYPPQMLQNIMNIQPNQQEQRLAKLILEGVESGSAFSVDVNYWNNKRESKH
jgi:hypothetical protein